MCYFLLLFIMEQVVALPATRTFGAVLVDVPRPSEPGSGGQAVYRVRVRAPHGYVNALFCLFSSSHFTPLSFCCFRILF
jgi:hypothetical protein